MPDTVDTSTLKLAVIVEDSIVDGPGLRLTVFTQGCPHHCPGCHNPQTHDPAGGHLEGIDTIITRYMRNPLLSGVTFSGGEPFMQPEALCVLGEKIHQLGGDVVTYTGFYFEDLYSGAMSLRPGVRQLLEITDLLIDGPYVAALRSLDLPFRGSSNQRLLDRRARTELAAAINNPCKL